LSTGFTVPSVGDLRYRELPWLGFQTASGLPNVNAGYQ
jgi:hypothetical protein